MAPKDNLASDPGKSNRRPKLQQQKIKNPAKSTGSSMLDSGTKRAKDEAEGDYCDVGPRLNKVELKDNHRKHSGFPRTDAGNAELFAALYAKNLRYDHARKRWLLWGTDWWVPDTQDRVLQLAKNAARYRRKLALELQDEQQEEKDEKGNNELKWALRSEGRQRLEAMLTLARSEPELADNGQNWDRDPLLLGVGNGVVDLSTGKLRPGERADRITFHMNVKFNPTAKCPTWLKFLSDIFDGNQDLIDYAQRAVGYSLTGSTEEHCVFNAFGEGANGKSTFLETIRYVLGPYAGALPFSTFEHKNKAAIPNDVASTLGKRFVTASETDESMRLNESRIKSMTGGDKQSARFLYKEYFEFEPTAKIWLAFNHKPEIQDDSEGMWRRMRLIPFNRTFKPEEQDKHLAQKLRREAPGILAWAVRGTQEYLKRGLDPPQAVVEATRKYREESDSVGNFIAECCLIGPGYSVESGKLWDAYMASCTETGNSPINRRAFARKLESLRLKRTREGRHRTRSWAGIKLVDDGPLDMLEEAAMRPTSQPRIDSSRPL